MEIGNSVMRARELLQEGQVSANQCFLFLSRPLLELSLAFPRCGKVREALKSQQSGGRILLGGMAGNTAMVVAQTLFQIDCTSNVYAAGAKLQEIDERDASRRIWGHAPCCLDQRIVGHKAPLAEDHGTLDAPSIRVCPPLHLPILSDAPRRRSGPPAGHEPFDALPPSTSSGPTASPSGRAGPEKRISTRRG